jgi:UDP-N-acetylglucosamine--N-acetylmuramyl-(pentapeptide) pyrophosphoryl-undecaprenol N-acetylglucosamine transferase
MKANASKPIIIAAGGTGGHFYPAEALAAELLARGERVVLLTDARSTGLASAVFARAEKHVISGAGLAGRGLSRALAGGLQLLKGTFEARALLKSSHPRAVVAFGGYPSVPPVLAAASLRGRSHPRVILHEQNAVLGRANRLLARFADLLALNFPTTLRVPPGVPTRVVGNPVRPAIAALQGQGYTPPGETIELFVLGGSLGAKVFSTLIPEALARLPAALRARLNLVQQVRAADVEQARAVLKLAGIKAELSPFFTNVPEHLARAHLVIARAGASSVAEIAVAGRPVLLIPLPTAIDDHQRENARALHEAGGGWCLDQAALTPDILAEKIETLLTTPETLVHAAAASAALGRIDAAARLADFVLEGVTP